MESSSGRARQPSPAIFPRKSTVGNWLSMVVNSSAMAAGSETLQPDTRVRRPRA